MSDTPDESETPELTPTPPEDAPAPSEATPAADAGGAPAEQPSEAPPTSAPPQAGPRAWLWAGGMVLLGIIVAGVVFSLATRTTSTSTAATITTQTASPATTLYPVATATPSATAAASATPAATPTATPGVISKTPEQLAAILFPDGGNECGPPAQYATNCPMDARLIASANAWITRHNPSSPAPLCRCPVQWVGAPTYVQNDNDIPAGYQGNPSYAAVDVGLTYSSTNHQTVVVIFVRQSDGSWLADDTNCAGAGGGSAGGTGNLLSNTAGSEVCVPS